MRDSGYLALAASIFRGPRRLAVALPTAALAPWLPASADPAAKSEIKLPPPASFHCYRDGQPVQNWKLSFARTTFEGTPAIVQ